VRIQEPREKNVTRPRRRRGEHKSEDYASHLGIQRKAGAKSEGLLEGRIHSVLMKTLQGRKRKFWYGCEQRCNIKTGVFKAKGEALRVPVRARRKGHSQTVRARKARRRPQREKKGSEDCSWK